MSIKTKAPTNRFFPKLNGLNPEFKAVAEFLSEKKELVGMKKDKEQTWYKFKDELGQVFEICDWDIISCTTEIEPGMICKIKASKTMGGIDGFSIGN